MVTISWSFFVILQVLKNVFLVFYSGERAKAKILKICEAFGANRYEFTEDMGKQRRLIEEVVLLYFLVTQHFMVWKEVPYIDDSGVAWHKSAFNIQKFFYFRCCHCTISFIKRYMLAILNGNIKFSFTFYIPYYPYAMWSH